MPEVVVAFVKGNSGADGEDEDGYDKTPEIDLLAVAEGKTLVGGLIGPAQSIEKENLVASVDEGVNPLGKHGGTPGGESGSELRQGNERISRQGGEDNFL
jgi:hypothetical protein